MGGWLRDHPRGRHGRHDYRLENHGITCSEVQDLFGDGIMRYGLSLG